MARRNLDSLAKLLEIYRQFSPEQKLREGLTQAQTENIHQNTLASQADVQSRGMMDPIQRAMLQSQATGVDLANKWDVDTRDKRMSALDKGLDMTAEQIVALKAQNAMAKEMNPMTIDFTRQSNPIQLSLLSGQQAAQANDASLFPLRKEATQLDLDQAKYNFQNAPENDRLSRASTAAQIMYYLSGSGYNPNGVSEADVGKQQMFNSFGGNAIPPSLTPNANAFKGLSQGVLQRFTDVQNGAENNPSVIAELFKNYPELAAKMIPQKRPQR